MRRRAEAAQPLAGLPKAPDDAVQMALETNPDLLAARLATKAAGYDIETADSIAPAKDRSGRINGLYQLPQHFPAQAIFLGTLPHTGTAQVALHKSVRSIRAVCPARRSARRRPRRRRGRTRSTASPGGWWTLSACRSLSILPPPRSPLKSVPDRSRFKLTKTRSTPFLRIPSR